MKCESKEVTTTSRHVYSDPRRHNGQRVVSATFVSENLFKSRDNRKAADLCVFFFFFFFFFAIVTENNANRNLFHLCDVFLPLWAFLFFFIWNICTLNISETFMFQMLLNAWLLNVLKLLSALRARRRATSTFLKSNVRLIVKSMQNEDSV